MSTLSSVPEELRLKVKLKLLFNDLPIDSETEIALFEATERIINQQIKSVLGEALANSVFKHKHEAEEHVVDYKNGYNDGVEAAEDVIKEIRSRYE